MRIAVVVCAPRGDSHLQWLWRFLNSYAQFPAMVPHDLVLLTDPGETDGLADVASVFHASIFQSEAPGLDISRYQAFCQQSAHDMVFFCGGTSYCRYPGWLLIAATSFKRNGPQNLYGAMGNNGVGGVAPHIRTTGFWCAPSLINSHPFRVTKPAQRYHYEHGNPDCLTCWTRANMRRAIVVDAEGEHEWPYFNDSPNGYQRGTQAALLIGDRLTEPPFYAFP